MEPQAATGRNACVLFTPACVLNHVIRAAILLLALASLGGAQWPRARARRPEERIPAFEREMLDAHNDLRARVRVAPLVWSPQAAAYAREWAETLLEHNAFEHRRDRRYGENLYEITGAAATPREVVRTWASEAANYNIRSNRCRGVCGHYTQLVWRNTRAVGCGVARGAGREVWVCDYTPPGNYIGERPY